MSKKKQKKPQEDPLLTAGMIKSQYGVPKNTIRHYFPKPDELRYMKKAGYYLEFWRKSRVERAIQIPEVKAEIERRQKSLIFAKQTEEIRPLLEAYGPDSILERGKKLKRAFILHVGPTNSGKTHDALRSLMESGNGTYLGPLRLLALEMFDRMNAAGAPCSLLTGEESIETENAALVSSTIELCNFSRRFQVAVIDEAQLITDPSRGAAWLRAICLVDAAEVHICLAPEARDIIENLVKSFGDPYVVVEHKRLVPL